ncbi:MAG: 23S rRNA (uracil(1939)-C(5))-methyltransferase RlmD [bacterium]
MSKFPPEFEITITKIISSGEGEGVYQGKKVRVYGVLPGEILLVRPTRVRRNKSTAAVIAVKKESPVRRIARDEHFSSCGPWQIIPEEEQLILKKSFVKEVFTREAGSIPLDTVEIVPSPANWFYRNKMEFSIANDQNGKLSLALHKRHRFHDYWFLSQCALAHEKINQEANRIISIIQDQRVTIDDLKNLVVRYSYTEDKCIGTLYVKNEVIIPKQMINKTFIGWSVVYSDPLSPAAKITHTLYTEGRTYLTEMIGGNLLQYHHENFFQVNPSAFEYLIEWVTSHMDGNGLLVDLYAGVGTIGLALAPFMKEVIGLEIDESAAHAIDENAQRNGIKNIRATYATAAESHNLESILSTAETVVVDPPRSGMHPKVLRQICTFAPEHFVYVSCNPETQARDFKELKKVYTVSNWRLFDLYPQTPHVESVLIMKRL